MLDLIVLFLHNFVNVVISISLLKLYKDIKIRLMSTQ